MDRQREEAPLDPWRRLVAAEVLLGAVLSVVFLGSHSLWLDESVSATLATAPWHVFTDVVAHREPNMALYYLLLRGWVVLGHGEATMRVLSVLAAVGALVVVIVLARRLFGDRVSLLCGLLLAVDPLFVQFAQDARGYALCLLLVGAASLLFVRGIRQPASRPWATWAAYAVLSALAAYSNFWAALVPLAHAASLGFLRKGAIPWRRLVPTAVVLALLLVPLALLIRATDNAGTNWAAGSSAGRLITRVRSAVPHAVIDLTVVVGIAVVVAAVALLRRRPAVADFFDRQWPVLFAGCWLVVPVAAVVLLSLVDKPLLVVRYLMVSLPPAVLLVAVLVARLWGRSPAGRGGRSLLRSAAPVVLVVALAGSLFETAQWYSHGGPQDFRSAVTYLAAQGRPGDGVLVYAPYERIGVEWYLQDHPAAERALHPVYPSLAWGSDPLYFDGPVTIDAADVSDAGLSCRRVWFVLASADEHLYATEAGGVEAGLRADGFVVVGSRAFRGVSVFEEVRLVRSSAASAGADGGAGSR